jgi:SAM-dependent methyltransferase
MADETASLIQSNAGTLVGQNSFKIRADVLRLVPPGASRVLDVGCGPGLTGEAIRAAGAREVWGVERDPGLAEQARQRLNRVVIGDIGEEPLLDLPLAGFDVLIYADVLEHLVDPWSVLATQRSLLRAGGHAVFSLPNVRHIRVVASLLFRGEWQYTDEGILSIGHLRFFTTRGMRRLINGAGFEIVREAANYAPRGALLRRLSLGLLDDLAAEQRLFLARVV